MKKGKRVNVHDPDIEKDLEPGQIEIFSSVSTVPRRSKSVDSPSTQTNILCENRGDLEQSLRDILSKRDYILKVDKVLWYIIEIQLASGARISEVLDIKPKHLLPTGHIVLHAKKGSQSRIIYVHDSRDYLSKCKLNRVEPFTQYNRFYVYREYKKYGIGQQFVGKKKASVTHFFRQMNARLQEMADVEKRQIANFLGQISTQSTAYYVSNKEDRGKTD